MNAGINQIYRQNKFESVGQMNGRPHGWTETLKGRVIGRLAERPVVTDTEKIPEKTKMTSLEFLQKRF
jgi:hypothetical protein